MTPEAQNALADLLVALFAESSELTRFLSFHSPEVLHTIPRGAPLQHTAHAAVMALEVRGLINDRLFDLLLQERPGRRDDIDRVRVFARTGGTTNPSLRGGPVHDEGLPEERRAFRERLRQKLRRAKDLPVSDPAPGWILAAAVLDDFNPVHLLPLDGRRGQGALVELAPVAEELPNGRWVLTLETRRAALRELTSQRSLEAALSANSGQWGPRSQWLNRLLSGASVNEGLSELSLDALRDLESVLDWFETIRSFPIDRGLVHAFVRRSELVAPLRALAGAHFRGRSEELARLEEHASGTLPPWLLVLHGPGGVGKSALLGRFLLEHQRRTGGIPDPWVYLDFDDPTVDPRQPREIVEKIAYQLALQYITDPEASRAFRTLESASAGDLLSFARLDLSTLEAQASQLASRLAMLGRPHFLVVLDTFEGVQIQGERTVQHVRELLGALHEAWPLTRVIVSGRGPIPEWADAVSLPLQSLDTESAGAVLENLGVQDPARQTLIIERFGTNPLTLRLASQAFAGAPELDVDEIAVKLGEARQFELQGQLYTRILGHISDGEIRKLAHPGLVVRRVTEEIVREVLAGPCGLDPTRSGPVFDKLQQYMSMFDRVDASTLRHRSDVRRTMLALMQVDPTWTTQIQEIHQAAASFYQRENSAEFRSERLYHLLCLDAESDELEPLKDDVPSLASAWDDPLPARARAWLGIRLGHLRGDSAWSLADWEVHAKREALAHLETGNPAGVLQLLGQRQDRTTGSPLFSLEAKARLMLDDVPGAWDAAQRGVDRLSQGEASQELLALRLTLVEIAERMDRQTFSEQARQALQLAKILRDSKAQLQIGVAELRRFGERDVNLDTVQSFLSASPQVLRANPQLSAPLIAALGARYPALLEKAITELGSDTEGGVFKPDAFKLERLFDLAAASEMGRRELDALAERLGQDRQSYSRATLASRAIRSEFLGAALQGALRSEVPPQAIVEMLDPRWLPPKPPNKQGAPMSELTDLLVSLFTTTELARLVSFHFPSIQDRIAFNGSLAAVAFEVVTTLKRDGLIDQTFWDRLLTERPGRRADIERVRASWNAGSPPGQGPVTSNPPAPITFQYLADITSLIREMVKGGLGSQRALDVMLEGVDQAFVAMVDPGGAGGGRLQVLLNRMNTTRTVRSGQVPLLKFLENASLQAMNTSAEPAVEAAYNRVRVQVEPSAVPLDATVPDDVLTGTLELQLGKTDQTRGIEFLVKGLAATRSVGKVVIARFLGGVAELGDGNVPRVGTGTGFVIAPGLLITNHHVIGARNPGEPEPSAQDFALQGKNGWVLFDHIAPESEIKVPFSELVLANKELDFALVRLQALPERVPLVLRKQRIDKQPDGTLTDRVNVLQHPNGDPMRLGFRDNFVVRGDAKWLSYLTDTHGGSSGSPIFDDGWTVAALHRGSRSLQGMSVTLHGQVIRSENYGIPIPTILEFLKTNHAALHTEIEAGQAAVSGSSSPPA